MNNTYSRFRLIIKLWPLSDSGPGPQVLWSRAAPGLRAGRWRRERAGARARVQREHRCCSNADVRAPEAKPVSKSSLFHQVYGY